MLYNSVRDQYRLSRGMAQLKDPITESYAKPQDFNMRPSFVGDVIL